MSSVGPFQITLRRQPGYELLLTVRLEVKKRYAGVLTLSRPGWQDDPPSRSREYRDVEASELRGGRFTLVHDGSERREGYSLARVTEQLLGRISADSWTELDPITEFGFRYLQIPEQALAATPAAAAVRTTVPQGASAPASVAPLSQARPSPAASSDRSSSGRGSLLARARHSASRQPMRSASQRGNNGGASVPAPGRRRLGGLDSRVRVGCYCRVRDGEADEGEGTGRRSRHRRGKRNRSLSRLPSAYPA